MQVLRTKLRGHQCLSNLTPTNSHSNSTSTLSPLHASHNIQHFRMPHFTPAYRVSKPLKGLKPAPPRQLQLPLDPALLKRPTSFLDLPAELRIEIYHMILKNVVIHIIPVDSDRKAPHSLLLTNKQINREVKPIIHTTCPIRATVTNFDFGGLMTWLSRISPHCHSDLAKNASLMIRLCTTNDPPGDLPTMRRWLHDRADPYRPQPDWVYSGGQPIGKVAHDLRRRVKRMKNEPGKQAELKKMIRAIGVQVPPTD